MTPPPAFLRLLPWAALALAAVPVSPVRAADEPMEWIEPATGHRVIQLTREPGSQSLYFHQNAYSADGQKLVITNPEGLATVNLRTHAIDQVVTGRVQVLVTGRKTGRIFYRKGDAIDATDLDTHATREMAQLPPQARQSTNIAVNADETLLVGIAVDPSGVAEPRQPPPGNGASRLEARWAEGRPMMLYTINFATGEFRVIHREHDWTNHLQCSPTDPGLIMFCHEGPWHFNDRIWNIRTDGTGLRLMHARTINMEIAGHEFFSGDGRSVWYDLQTPQSTVFWLAGVDLATGQRTWYHLERKEWSVHYNVSHDGRLFAGDGGGPASVANRSPDGETLNPPGNGQWIYLFHPVLAKGNSFRHGTDLIQAGYFKAEPLVDLSRHNYRLEPNLTFTPDDHWIIFRSNMRGGASQVYAVEVAKAAP